MVPIPFQVCDRCHLAENIAAFAAQDCFVGDPGPGRGREAQESPLFQGSDADYHQPRLDRLGHYSRSQQKMLHLDT